MNAILRVISAAALSTAAFAQESPVEPANAVKAELVCATAVAASDATVGLDFTLRVLADCTAQQTLLTGHHLQAFVADKMRNEYKALVPNKVPLVKGTTVTRRIDVDLKLVFGGASPTAGAETVTLRWPGLQGAELQLRVAPDQKSLDLAQLDLTKTRVQLVTSLGDMVVSFFPDKAPKHVENFVKLAKDGFYNQTRFHRVLKGFMIQGGCPNTKPGGTGTPGTGNPGWTVDAEFNDVRHVRGILSMARSPGPNPNTAGSQFFLMHGDATHLDGQYSAFGKLESGLETLDKIASVPVGGEKHSDPVEPVHLYAAIVLPVMKS